MDDDSQALALLDLLYRVTRSVADDVREHVDEVSGLDLNDFALLRAIAAGQRSPGVLSKDLGLHPAAMSRSITRLARAGLVRRDTDPIDSRRISLSLTSDGEKAASRVAHRVRPLLQARLDALPPGSVDDLLRSLTRLLRS